MSYHWLIPLIASAATLVLGALVLRTTYKTRLGRVLAFLSVCLVLWNLNFFVLYYVSDRQLAFDLTRILRTGSIFLPVAILHLNVAFRDNRARAWTWVLALDYAIALALAWANSQDLMVSGLRAHSFGYYSISGPWYKAYALLVIGNFSAATLLLLRDYRTTSDPRLRAQLRFWLLGLAIALPLGITNLLPAYGFRAYPLGSVGNAIWVGVISYAIRRHRLMDIELILSKGAAYIAASLVIVIPAFLASLAMQQRMFGDIHPDFSFALLLLFIAIGILFPPLRVRTEAHVEHMLFHGKHEYRAALASFAKSLIRIVDRDELIKQLGDKLAETLQPTRLAIFLERKQGEKLELRYCIGGTPKAPTVEVESDLARVLKEKADAVIRAELETLDVAEARNVASILKENNWELCVPLVTGNHLIGVLALGTRRDLGVYSIVDLELLASLAAQAAIACENAQLYEELQRTREAVHRAGRMSALGTLAAGIAHEIRNPLVSIQTFLQLAPQRLSDEEFVTTFLGLAESEVKRINELVSELLAFGRPYSDTVQEMDLDEIIDGALRLLRPEAQKQGVKLIRLGGERLPAVYIDADKIKQVLINIVLNAIEATEGGGIVSVATGVVDWNRRQFCRVEIRDTGKGIPKESQEEIFNPFFTTKETGTGLGLSIANQIITAHGGFITVESGDRQGTCFAVYLPLGTRGVERGFCGGASGLN